MLIHNQSVLLRSSFHRANRSNCKQLFISFFFASSVILYTGRWVASSSFFFSMSNIILSLIFLCCISILPSAFAGRREEALGVGAAHFVSMCCPSRLLLYFTDLLFLWQRHWLIDRFDKPAGGHKYRRSSRKISRERKKEKKTHLIRSSQRGKWGDVSQIP